MLRTRCLFIISNKLKSFLPLFQEVVIRASFDIKIVNYAKFNSDNIKEILMKYNSDNMIIAIENRFYSSVYHEFNTYLRDIFKISFSNIIHLYINISKLTDKEIEIGTKHCYYISDYDKYPVIALNFILYCIKVFSESTLSSRLYDYISTSFKGIVDSELLKKKKAEIERLNKELEKKNKIDSLTKIYNRNTIFQYLELEFTKLRSRVEKLDNKIIKEIKEGLNHSREKTIESLLNTFGIYSLMMIDVDHFKNVNDIHGHLIGDDVLRTIGQLLSDDTIFRKVDIPGRFGGEEFLVILPGTNAQKAILPAKQFKEKLYKNVFQGKADEEFHVTVSIGISESSFIDTNKEDIIVRSDKALYWAKGHGRNQVIIYKEVFENNLDKK